MSSAVAPTGTVVERTVLVMLKHTKNPNECEASLYEDGSVTSKTLLGSEGMLPRGIVGLGYSDYPVTFKMVDTILEPIAVNINGTVYQLQSPA